MAAENKQEGSTPAGSSSESSISSSQIRVADDDLLLPELPTRDGWLQPLALYKNYWLTPQRIRSIELLQSSFRPRHDDIILVSNPKCGTTWMKALAFAVTNRTRYEFSDHPLLLRHPQEIVPFIEIPRDGDLAYVETLPSPRLLATHMPLSLCPKSIASCGCRVVYVCRDPKDQFVSLWHMLTKISADYKVSLEDNLDMFSEGFSPYGPFWEHCLEYWRESISSPDRILFLKYEDMISDPVKCVIRLATFLGVPFSTKEKEEGVPEEVVRLCSFENLSSLQANQTGVISWKDNLVAEKSSFFRKGKVGDWRNHMTVEMGRKIDCIVEEKLKDSGLVL